MSRSSTAQMRRPRPYESSAHNPHPKPLRNISSTEHYLYATPTLGPAPPHIFSDIENGGQAQVNTYGARFGTNCAAYGVNKRRVK
jgi:hypothetical protein